MHEYEWEEQVDDFLETTTESALWVLVAYGWWKPSSSPEDVELGFMTCTIDNFPDVVAFLMRQTPKQYSFNFGASIPLRQMEALRKKFSAIQVRTLAVRGLDPHDKWHIVALRQICSKYAAARWLERGVALVDICGFTTTTSPRQLAQLLSLTRAAHSAYLRLKGASTAADYEAGHELPLDFCRSTTGDGYYIWNSVFGQHGDAAVLALLLQIMSVIEQRRAEPREGTVRIRAAFTVGEIYQFEDQGIQRDGRAISQYIVGPATNYLARVLTDARPGQLLLGDFGRRAAGDEGAEIGPQELLDEALDMLRFGLDSDLADRSGACFIPDHKLRIVDKHGQTHYCYNVGAHIPNRIGESRFVQPVGLTVDETPALDGFTFRPPAPAMSPTEKSSEATTTEADTEATDLGECQGEETEA